MDAAGIECRLMQNMDDSWSLRFGPLSALEAGRAVTAFVR